MLDLTWDYPIEGEQRRAGRRGGAAPRSTAADADGRPLSAYTELADDGSTACGCWIYSGVYADEVNQAARRKPGDEQGWIAPEWGWAWPVNRRAALQPRLGPTRRRARGANARSWSGGTRTPGEWTGYDVPDFEPTRAAGLPAARARHRPGGAGRAPTRSSCRPTARAGCSPRPGWWTGRCPPTTSRRSRRSRNPLYGQQRNPGAAAVSARAEPVQPAAATSRAPSLPVRGHHLPADRALHRGRDEPTDAVPG